MSGSDIEQWLVTMKTLLLLLSLSHLCHCELRVRVSPDRAVANVNEDDEELNEEEWVHEENWTVLNVVAGNTNTWLYGQLQKNIW